LSEAFLGLVCVTTALATTFVSDQYGCPRMLYALLFGMAFHFLSEDGRCVRGVDVAARTILRLESLCSASITLEQILALGAGPVVTVTAGVVSTIVVGVATLSSVAMVVYPVVVGLLELGDGALPSFLVAFVVLVLINSTGLMPDVVTKSLSSLSRCAFIVLGGVGG